MCGAEYLESELDDIRDYHERVAPGEICPAGQCPDDECGGLCHYADIDEPPNNQAELVSLRTFIAKVAASDHGLDAVEALDAFEDEARALLIIDKKIRDPGEATQLQPSDLPTARAMLGEAISYARLSFWQDESIDGGDFVEWFTEWRDRAKAVLNDPVFQLIETIARMQTAQEHDDYRSEVGEDKQDAYSENFISDAAPTLNDLIFKAREVLRQ
jgi:hypothetical protein